MLVDSEPEPDFDTVAVGHDDGLAVGDCEMRAEALTDLDTDGEPDAVVLGDTVTVIVTEVVDEWLVDEEAVPVTVVEDEWVAVEEIEVRGRHSPRGRYSRRRCTRRAP